MLVTVIFLCGFITLILPFFLAPNAVVHCITASTGGAPLGKLDTFRVDGLSPLVISLSGTSPNLIRLANTKTPFLLCMLMTKKKKIFFALRRGLEPRSPA